MGEALRAARLHDPVAHSHALAGFVAGAVVGVVASVAAAAVIGLAVGALEVATAGLATPLVLGAAATAVEFGANLYIGTKITEWADAEGERIGSESLAAPSGQVSQGSFDVFINGRFAARAGDAETCDAGIVAQGSASVFFNNRPAARLTDKTSCGGQIVDGARNVFIGGSTVSVTAIQPEVPEWVRWAAMVAGVLPALGQAARALGPALAEVRAGGLLRAAQVGAKAAGRAMEERGARALARADHGLAVPEGAPGAARATPDTPPHAVETVPDGVPLSQETFDRVRSQPNGMRDAPDTYLPPAYVQQHLSQFDEGGSYLVRTRTLDDYGRDPLGRADGQFIMPKSQMDDLLQRTGSRPDLIEKELGIPPGSWDRPGETISRIDIDDPAALSLRMPSGNEAGANPLWMPGGKLPGGGSEAVIDAIPAGAYRETIIGR